MIVKCDVVKCIYNYGTCKCNAGIVKITLTHDELSENEYIKCDTMVIPMCHEQNKSPSD